MKEALVVEDDLDVQELIIFHLQRILKDFRFVESRNGSDALHKIKTSSYEFVLLDYSLPKMDGLEIMDELRKEGIDTPVIMMTAMGNEKIADLSWRKGVADYIVKEENFYSRVTLLVFKRVGAIPLRTGQRVLSLRTHLHR